jgi:hypothetical protein
VTNSCKQRIANGIAKSPDINDIIRAFSTSIFNNVDRDDFYFDKFRGRLSHFSGFFNLMVGFCLELTNSVRSSQFI